MAISSEGLSQSEYEALGMFPSWSLVDGEWTPPSPQPTDGQIWNWDEDNLQWVLAPIQEGGGTSI